MTVKLRQKPVTAEALQWNANEAEMREFINDDSKVKIGTDDTIRVWNNDIEDWLKVNTFDYVIKRPNGSLIVAAGSELDKIYERLE